MEQEWHNNGHVKRKFTQPALSLSTFLLLFLSSHIAKHVFRVQKCFLIKSRLSITLWIDFCCEVLGIKLHNKTIQFIYFANTITLHNKTVAFLLSDDLHFDLDVLLCADIEANISYTKFYSMTIRRSKKFQKNSLRDRNISSCFGEYFNRLKFNQTKKNQRESNKVELLAIKAMK